ncbi:MAG: universal stress protein F [Gammaproteobacteria bacterium]|jgi:universal stress protein F
MYQQILVPIDMAHKERAAAMIEVAQAQLDKNGKITLLNVFEDVPNWVASSLPADILSKTEASAHKALREIAGENNTSINVQVCSGRPYQSILKVAEDIEAELIVVASHHPDIGDYFLGSTAAKVVRHANCSVFVLR